MARRDDPPLSLHTPATEQALDAVHSLLHQFWHQVSGMADADRMRFDLAVAEVAANIVEHCPASSVEMTLNLRQYEDRVEADFEENGEPLPSDVIEAATEPSDVLAESGRGLVLARAALDEFSYDRSEGVNRWHLVRRRHS